MIKKMYKCGLIADEGYLPGNLWAQETNEE